MRARADAIRDKMAATVAHVILDRLAKAYLATQRTIGAAHDRAIVSLSHMLDQLRAELAAQER